MELELLRYIQSAASPVLDVFFIGITMLAEPALWVVVLAWIYWNSDKTAGRFISYAMFTSLCFGNGLKAVSYTHLTASKFYGLPGRISRGKNHHTQLALRRKN